MSADNARSALSAALEYAARGWPVLPIHPKGKTPLGVLVPPLGVLVPRGLLDAITDPDTLRLWWTNHPHASVGIRTGAISRFFVIDVDPRHGGAESLDSLEREHGKLPQTVTARTGGGGLHLLFAYPSGGVVLRNAVQVGGRSGLDLRSDGGYIVAPPSSHVSGGQYCWEPGRGPDEIELATAPAWLLAVIQRRLASVRLPHAADVIADGARNSTLASLAGIMRHRGMTEDAIVAALFVENAQRCVPPLPHTEVKGIAASISRYGAASASAAAPARRSRATDLVALADGELFHTPDGEAFATFAAGDHHETWPLRTKGFRRWLARRFYEQTGGVPGVQALQDAITVLEGRALYEGAEHSVFIRVASREGTVYLDLGNDRWDVVRIRPDGWDVVPSSPVKFRRSRGLAALPIPVRGGRIHELRTFVNVATEKDWVLVAGWLFGVLSPNGPYPILVLHGEQGSAKSTTARLLRALTDPNTSPLRAEPKDARDLMIAATNGWVLALDNVSSLAPWLSDALCRLSSGGGFATRELHTDSDEVLFDAQRPLILNGITEIATHSDLLDRVISVELPPIPETARRTEDEVRRQFEEARPRLLGALYDAVAAALRNRSDVRLTALPRMADFCVWVTASETALAWKAGTFFDAYVGNRAETHDLALDASPLAAEIRALLVEIDHWTGTAGDLLVVLRDRTDPAVIRQRTWPSTARSLAGALRRLAPNFRAVGITVEFSRETVGARRRIITLRTVAGATVPSVSTVPPAHLPLDLNPDEGRIPDGGDGRYAESPKRSAGARPEDNDVSRRPQLFSVWPETLAGLGARHSGPYAQCVQCGTGTWSRYGDRPLCLQCANHAAEQNRRGGLD